MPVNLMLPSYIEADPPAAFDPATAPIVENSLPWDGVLVYDFIKTDKRWVAVGYFYESTSVYYPCIIHSANGVTWTRVYFTSFTNTGFSAIAYDGNEFYVRGYEVFAASTNGTSWGAGRDRQLGNINDMIYANGEYFLTSDQGLWRFKRGSSPWTKIPLMLKQDESYSNGRVCYANGMYVYVNYSFNQRAFISFDSYNWKAVTVPEGNWSYIYYFDNTWIACSYNYNPNHMMISADGINWTIVSGAPNVTHWTYGAGYLFGVQDSGQFGTSIYYTDTIGGTFQRRSIDNPGRNGQYRMVSYLGNGRFIYWGLTFGGTVPQRSYIVGTEGVLSYARPDQIQERRQSIDKNGNLVRTAYSNRFPFLKQDGTFVPDDPSLFATPADVSSDKRFAVLDENENWVMKYGTF